MVKYYGISIVLIGLFLSSLGCIKRSKPSSKPNAQEEIPPLAQKSLGEIKLHEAIFLGTHNSYSKSDSSGPDYSFGISEQLDRHIRVLEFDIVNDSGEVNHGPGLLMERHCSDIEGCLYQVGEWSKAHPNHTPIIIFVEISTANPLDADPEYEKKIDKVIEAIHQHHLSEKLIRYDDHNTTVDGLRGKMAVVIYRKSSAYTPIRSTIKGISHKLKKEHIFIAGRYHADIDMSFKEDELSFLRWDWPPTKENFNPGSLPVFISSMTCSDDECSGDQERVKWLMKNTVANGWSTNRIETLAEAVDHRFSDVKSARSHPLRLQIQSQKSPIFDDFVLNLPQYDPKANRFAKEDFSYYELHFSELLLKRLKKRGITHVKVRQGCWRDYGICRARPVWHNESSEFEVPFAEKKQGIVMNRCKKCPESPNKNRNVVEWEVKMKAGDQWLSCNRICFRKHGHRKIEIALPLTLSTCSLMESANHKCFNVGAALFGLD